MHRKFQSKRLSYTFKIIPPTDNESSDYVGYSLTHNPSQTIEYQNTSIQFSLSKITSLHPENCRSKSSQVSHRKASSKGRGSSSVQNSSSSSSSSSTSKKSFVSNTHRTLSNLSSKNSKPTSNGNKLPQINSGVESSRKGSVSKRENESSIQQRFPMYVNNERIGFPVKQEKINSRKQFFEDRLKKTNKKLNFFNSNHENHFETRSIYEESKEESKFNTINSNSRIDSDRSGYSSRRYFKDLNNSSRRESELKFTPNKKFGEIKLNIKSRLYVEALPTRERNTSVRRSMNIQNSSHIIIPQTPRRQQSSSRTMIEDIDTLINRIITKVQDMRGYTARICLHDLGKELKLFKEVGIRNYEEVCVFKQYNSNPFYVEIICGENDPKKLLHKPDVQSLLQRVELIRFSIENSVEKEIHKRIIE